MLARSRPLRLLPLLTALGCAPPQTHDSEADEPRIAARLLDLQPADGDEARFAADPLWVDFDTRPAGFGLTLRDASDTEVSGRGAWVTSTRYLFTPSYPLAPSEEHTVVVAWLDDGEPRIERASFSSAAPLTETPLHPSFSARFDVDFSSATILSPALGAAVLDTAGLVLLHEIKRDVDSGLASINAMAAVDSPELDQDFCAPSFHMSEAGDAFWDDPFFSHGPLDVPAAIRLPFVGRVPIVLYDLRLSGVLSADAPGGVVDRVDEVAFSAFIDARDAGLGNACGQLAFLFPGIECEPCPGDEVVECLNFQGIGGVAHRSKSGNVVPRSATEISADPICD